MIERASEDLNRAGEIPPLLTETREIQARPVGGAEDILLDADLERVDRPVGELQLDGKGL